MSIACINEATKQTPAARERREAVVGVRVELEQGAVCPVGIDVLGSQLGLAALDAEAAALRICLALGARRHLQTMSLW